MKIFVTGGAGYIGSHVGKALGEKGHEILVYDNLSSGHEWAVLYGKLVQGDLTDTKLLNEVLADFKPDAVMHFAASITVSESVKEPLRYYRNNTANALNLLEAMAAACVDKLIFSSTAALYGVPETVPITETATIAPINPYGASKAMVEQFLSDMSTTGAVKYVSLRYFNAAGADPDARIGESHDPEFHLIPLVLKAAKGERRTITIFGTDYPTADGSCIRDYIHVNDLAAAHVAALDHLMGSGESRVYNCGYGHGYSVKEIISTAKKVTGIDFSSEETDRRPGDPPALVADSSKLKEELGWQPVFDDIEFIIKTAWAWEKERKGKL
jgi:UDP-glucose 4-epimerase